MNKLSIIIVNYNTDDLTIQAVDSVIKFVSNVSYEIIVIDNNSPIKTKLDSLLRGKPNTTFYQLETNIGFGRANNYAYSKSKGEYIFLLNSDAYLMDDSLEKMISFMDKDKNQKIACLGGTLYDNEGNLNRAYGNFYTKQNILSDFKLSKDDRIKDGVVNFSISKEVDYIIGAAVLIRNSVIQKLGLFSKKYFMYYEDMDLAFRYKKNGFFSVVNPSFKFVHIGGQSGYQNSLESFKGSLTILYSKYQYSRNFCPAILAEFIYVMYIIQFLYAYSILHLKRKMVSFKRMIVRKS